MKKGSPLEELLNETGEWHSLWLGFVRGWMKLKIEHLSEELQQDIKKEYHYHLFGFFIARLIQVAGLVFLASKIFG